MPPQHLRLALPTPRRALCTLPAFTLPAFTMPAFFPSPRPRAQTHQNDLNRVMTALQYECARDSQEGVVATLLDGLADQQAKEVRGCGCCCWGG